MTKIILTGDDLTLKDLIKISRNKERIQYSPFAKKMISYGRGELEKLITEGKTIYGINTGFGSLANVKISDKEIEELQENLIKSHAAGTGQPLEEDVVRAAMAIRANTFSQGRSGIRPSIAQKLVTMINKGIYPHVPEKGSVGASGDLSPLSHIALVLIGSGEAYIGKRKVKGKIAMRRAGITPAKLKAKEGLALNNGTSVMAANLGLGTYDSIRLAKNAMIAAAATSEALKANKSYIDERIHNSRKHNGQKNSAYYLRKILEGSELIDSSEKVQDAYSVRCFPQVIGATIDTINYVKNVVETEINSVTDNPLIFWQEALSGGNFHGQPLALAGDYLGIAISEIGSISERRTFKMLDPCLNEGLPAFLTSYPGKNSGLMIVQYTAANLASENKVLAHPASIDSIPTSANQEDHVSMGSISCKKARDIVNNVEEIVAIEMYTAMQALEYRTEKPSPTIQKVKDRIRQEIKPVTKDRELYKDIQKMNSLLKSEELIYIVEKEIEKIEF